MSQTDRRNTRRKNQIETLEDRLAMAADVLEEFSGVLTQHSADAEQPQHVAPHSVDGSGQLSQHGNLVAPPDFWIDPVVESINNVEASLGELEQTMGDLQQTLNSAHGTTGLDAVRANYGFVGTGQTVAVIDSGIAYDHYALGGGYGSGYRVVGGWDFSGSGDSDPYDNGPLGSHGTHVAGIIGSEDSTHQGVAPGVDLVGLRVFDDTGAGYFEWVESALQWVHHNRFAFDNPITAVNLSLGTDWNSSSIPAWTMLEDEFAQLEADGIFISVSAGNSFQSYNEPGLSYPAASPYVAPVMSVDDSGGLSSFSQRHQRALAAPGRYIYSTVPDYAGNNNGLADDWANFSGTSMAAPYVAGASVLVREAMEFVGLSNLTQDNLFDHLKATADGVWDPDTEQWYSRLNLQRAIDVLMPVDDYGSSELAAYNLGTISTLSQASSTQVNGVISTLGDGDYFTFTAESSGSVTFEATSMSHGLVASWQGYGGEGWTNEGGDSYTINVVAGQQYTISIGTSGGLGYYSLNVSADSSFSYSDWGALSGQQLQSGVTVSGGQWFRVVAANSGFLTAQAQAATGTVGLSIYDADMNLISGVGARADALVWSGDEYFVRIDGNADLDVRLTNLVKFSGTSVIFAGGDGNDTYAFLGGTDWQTAWVNGVGYAFPSSYYTDYRFEGGAGIDWIEITGSAGDDRASIGVGNTSVSGERYGVTALGFEYVDAYGGGGDDHADMQDSTGDDQYEGRSGRSTLTGTGFQHYANGFDRVNAFATTGADTAVFYDSSGNDRYYAHPTNAFLYGDGFFNYAHGFDRFDAYATAGGYDQATLTDSAGDDVFYGHEASSYIQGAGFRNSATGFDRVDALANAGGTDTAELTYSAGDDNYWTYDNIAYLYNSDSFIFAGFFEVINADSSGGLSSSAINESPSGDTAVAAMAFASVDGEANQSGGASRGVEPQQSTGATVESNSLAAGDEAFGIEDLNSYARGSVQLRANSFDRLASDDDEDEEETGEFGDAETDLVYEKFGAV